MRNQCNSCNQCGQNFNCCMKGCFSNKVQNPGFEQPLSMGCDCKNWDASVGVERTDKASLVHTGDFAVILSENASISQTLFRVCPGKQYDFSFFAKFGSTKDEKEGGKSKGKDSDSDKDKDKEEPDFKDALGLKATVTVVTRCAQFDIQEICIAPGSLGDEYGFYRAITCITPCDAIAVIIRFSVTDSKVRPHTPHHFGVCIDDVAFTKC